MLEFSRLPRTVKGALVCLRSDFENPMVDFYSQPFLFQYNPEMLTHTFSSPNSQEVVKQEEKRSTSSKIVELITLSLEFDATDQLEQPDLHKETVEYGLHPALAFLESIVLSQSGTKESAPLVLFVWGSSRVVPVALENVKILEEAFDTNLNPVRAKIELVMRVLDHLEFKNGSLGCNLCLAHLDRRKLFTQKYVKNRIYRDVSKQISRIIKQLDQNKKMKGRLE